MAQASTILDMAHLAQYTRHDPGLEAELLGLFQAQSRIQLEQLDQAARENDAAMWKFALHTLKGMAQSLGAFDVAETAGALEREAPGAAGHGRLAASLAACEREILRRSA